MKFVDLATENNLFKAEILEAYSKIVSSGKYLFGEEVKVFEENFAKLIGQKYCVALANATDALILSLKAVCEEDTAVICPNFTAMPTASAIKEVTNKIRYVDVDNTLTINPKKISHIRNAVILAVNLFGNNCNISKIRKICERNNNILIMDCAQSTGSGVLGDISCFSFYPTKLLGAISDGGCITTDNKEYADKIRRMAFYGMDPNNRIAEEVEYPGINSRMCELTACTLNIKMKQFNILLDKRREICDRYLSCVSGSVRWNKNAVFHQFPVLYWNRELIMQELYIANIPFDNHYSYHVSEVKPYSTSHKVGNRINDKIITFPCHPFMTEEEILKVENFLKEWNGYECKP